MTSIYLPDKIDAVITSYGGVGTTFVISFISNHMKTNDPYDKDNFKHSQIPLLSSNPKLKFVYLYGNPQLAVFSIFRRGYQLYHLKKLRRWSKNIPKYNQMTLDIYAKKGLDLFDLRGHFFNWYDKYINFPIMFIRYETLYENLDELFNFLDIPKKYIDKFPKKNERVSKIENIAHETLNDLDRIYEKFNSELLKLDDVEIKCIKNMSNKKLILSEEYRRAILFSQAEKYFPNIHKNIRKFNSYKNYYLKKVF